MYSGTTSSADPKRSFNLSIMAVVNIANGFGFLQYLTIQVNGKCEKHENWQKDGIPAKGYPVITLVVTV